MRTDSVISGDRAAIDPFERIEALREECRYDEAEALLQAEINVAVAELVRARLHVAQGQLRLHQHLFEEALRCFGAAMSIAPDHGPAIAGWIEVLCRLGRRDEALGVAESHAGRFPKCVEFHLAVAVMHEDACRFDLARTAYGAAARIGPKQSAPALGRARALRGLGRYADAVTQTRAAADRFPESAALRLAVCETLVAAEDEDAAREALAQAEELAPDSAEVLRVAAALEEVFGTPEAAVQAAARALEAAPRSPRALVALGTALTFAGRIDDAVAELDKALSLSPRWADAWEWKIYALRNGGRAEDAVRVGAEAVAACPWDPDVLAEVGITLLRQGHRDQGLARIDEALAMRPGHGWALLNRVEMLQAGGAVEDAVTAAEQAAALWPHRGRMLLVLARTYALAGRAEDAAAAYARAVSAEPRNPAHLLEYVELLVRLARWKEAAAAVEEGLERVPDPAAVHARWAEILHAHGRDRQALRILDAVPSALRLKAQVQSALGDQTGAVATAHKVVRAESGTPQAQVFLSRILDAAHRPEEAIEAADQALGTDPDNAEAWAGRILALRTAGHWDQAAAETDRRLADRPDFPGARCQAAALALARHRPAEALPHLTAQLDAERDHPVALRLLGAAHRDLGQWQQAESTARRLTTAAPGSGDGHHHLGLSYEGRDRYEDALAAYDQALAREPHHPAATERRIAVLRILDRTEEAQAAITALLAADEHSTTGLLQSASLATAQGHHEDALPPLEAVLADRPHHGEALSALARAHSALGRWDQAEATARRHLAARPRAAAGYVDLARILTGQDRFAEALEAYEHALEREPAHPAAATGAADALRRLGRLDDAEQHARERSAIRPHDPKPHIELALVCLGRQEPLRAVTHARRARELAPTSWSAVNTTGVALRRSRQWEAAEQIYRDHLGEHPDDPECLLALGDTLTGRDRYEDALVCYQAVLARDPGHVPALTRQITALGAVHRWDEAERTARDVPELRTLLAECLIGQHREEEALALLDGPGPRPGAAPRGVPHRATPRSLTTVTTGTGPETGPEAADSCRIRMRALTLLGRDDEAESAARGLLERAPHAADVRIALARLLRRRRRGTEALAECERALAQDPYDVAAREATADVLRTLRSFDEAERVLRELTSTRPHLRSLRFALGQVHAARRDFAAAEAELAALQREAAFPAEEAEVRAHSGWLALGAGRAKDAADRFDQAMSLAPLDSGYPVGKAWALLRQCEDPATGPYKGPYEHEAARLCRMALGRDPRQFLAHTCLGVIGFRQGAMAAAEHHFKRCLELQPFQGCHVDLGALYTRLGRYDEAEAALRRAVEIDWYDVQAHIELGNLALLRASADAAEDFRRALAIDADSGSAALGLALATALRSGDHCAAETVLRAALARRDLRDQPEWRLRLALARLLLQAGDNGQRTDLHEAAATEVRRAVHLAADQPEAYFVAGVIEQRLCGQTADIRLRMLRRRRAQRFLTQCRKLDPAHRDAERALRLLDEEGRVLRSSRLSGAVLVTVASALLAVTWIDFVWKHHVTATMATTLTPLLAALTAGGLLLPLLVRLKLPVELDVDLSAGINEISPGPGGRSPRP